MKTFKSYVKLLFAALGFTILIISLFSIFITIVDSDKFMISHITGMIASMLFKSKLFFICFIAISVALILLKRLNIINDSHAN